MYCIRVVLAAALFSVALLNSSDALEGSATAGPTGGTDIRNAQLPPPGVYGGLVLVHSHPNRFFDGNGQLVPALKDLEFDRNRVGGFLVYVPPVQIFGGSIGIGAFVRGGRECGRLFGSTPKRCISGFGDPYVEADWSRFFGTMRPSKYPGAFPIAEGLTVAFGAGMVIPIGRYNATDATTQGLTIGNNIWDFAPTVAFTYVTPPLIADGTEFSARLYWNNYLTNPDTQYSTGAMMDLDFAVTEKIGRFQVGVAGFYAFQIADDKRNGIPVAPDGKRMKVVTLGPVLAYDMPEYGASLKLKVLTTLFARNTVDSSGVALTLYKKLH